MKTLREYLDTDASEHTQLGTRLTHFIGIPLVVASLPTLLVQPLLGAGMFTAGWAFQFVGHYGFEKNSPAFFGDPLYLLVGPLWVLIEILQMLGLDVLDTIAPHPTPAPASEPAATTQARAQA